MNRIIALGLFFALPILIQAAESDWIRPPGPEESLVWGHKNGIVFGIPSIGGMPGPRGLIRVGIAGREGKPELINFVAVEPVVKGPVPRHARMGFSELESSVLDNAKQGKRLWTNDFKGEIFTSGTEEFLRVKIDVERFTANGAHVYVIAQISASQPDELQLMVHHHKDSAPIEELTLSATMGNYERLRQLWLKDRIVDSRELYQGYFGKDFVERQEYPMADMRITDDGDPIVWATTDEDDPSSSSHPAKSHWRYKSIKLTQYWRMPKEHMEKNLRVRVNGRLVYWKSWNPIPGGISFENFELRQAYVPGQMFIFGLTPNPPR